MNLTASKISGLLSQNTQEKTFVGFADEPDSKNFVHVNAMYTKVSDLENIVVAPGPILLKDVATVFFDLKDETTYSRVNGKEAVSVALINDSQANLIELSHRVSDVIEKLNEKLAPLELEIVIQENKAVVAATIGQKPYEEGFRLVIAHIDCPRLDLRPNPLYESDHMSYFRTHYYGGIRKYQWATIPLAIHGVFTRADGSSVNFAIGEDENDPVFCITDLLPHLGAEQNERKLSEGIKGEELNVLIGSDTVEEEDVKEAVKLNTLILLNQKYGITERDFTRAEIEVVPAAKARDVGFDRSMIGAYGHDDRVDAYPALLAEIETKDPVHTTICVLTDKEEIGSDGVTGMQSMYVFHFMQMLCRAAGQDDILAFRNSVCLSADVTAAFDPSWASAFEKQNGTYAGRGIAIFMYTGSRGKSSASDANAELLGDITRMLDANNVAWQIGEMGRLDLGGGGTIAKYVANRGIKVLDMGVPVLSMHSPFEVIHKTDLYMAYRTFSVFCQSAD